MHLKEDQFGYLGRHYIVGLPEEWTKVPTFAEVGDLVAEIQVRTLAQHMWAEASHLLQYKQEESVPNSIRRSLSRSSALLELLDLEFDRVLSERDDYRKDTERTNKAASINVDNLEQILDESLPIANKDDDESYSDLVAELSHFGVATVGDLRSLIDKRRVGALEQESKRLAEAYEELSEGRLFSSTEEERVSKGVFFSHVGLMRCMISDEFGREMLNNFWHSIDDTY